MTVLTEKMLESFVPMVIWVYMDFMCETIARICLLLHRGYKTYEVIIVITSGKSVASILYLEHL